MSDWLLALVPHYGLALIFATTLLSCLALPAPSSLIMLSAGGFAASGELVLMETGLAALAGAILGDITGFIIGQRAASLLERKAGKLTKARSLIQRRGSLGVFLSRWLVSPLGPYVNLVAGAGGLAFLRFFGPAVLGEVVWVSLYVGLGYWFSGQVVEIASLLGNASGLLAGLAVTIGLGLWLRHAARSSARNLAITS